MRKSNLMSAGVLLAITGAAQAVPITVQNASFESNTGVGDYPPPSNWTVDGTLVGANAGFTEGFNQIGNPTGGDALRYSGIDGGTLAQDLGVPFLANSTYTVRFLVGNRNAFGEGLTQYGLKSSTAFGTDLGTVASVDNDATVPNNTFAEGPVYTFTTDATPPSGNVVVFFRGVDDLSGTANNTRAVVDLARVDVAPVPEPAALGLLGVAGTALLARRRRAAR
jgi:hypothetical protein